MFALRKLMTPLFVLAFVLSSFTYSAPADANHITCSILHFPLAAYAGDGIYSAYGYAQLNCNGTPTMSYIQVQVATNHQFDWPIATNQLTCYNEPNCATSTTPQCCYTAADYVHTRANGWWQDGHGNKITIPWTGWNCFNIGAGGAANGRDPGSPVSTCRHRWWQRRSAQGVQSAPSARDVALPQPGAPDSVYRAASEPCVRNTRFGACAMQPPTLTKLLRVIGVGTTTPVDGVAISLLAVEIYTDGFAIPLLVQLGGGRTFEMGRMPPNEPGAELAWRVTDDLGNVYVSWPRSAGGTNTEWRFHFGFSPALAPEARSLGVGIDSVALRRYSDNREQGIREIRWPGPWEFSVGI